MTQALQRYRNLVFDSARWDGFVFRDHDIVISTPPKSGTTWMQMMCALLIFQDPVLPGRLTELSPWLDIQTAPLTEVVAALEAQAHRRFIKTDTPLDGLPFDERVTYVCVGRDPHDIALSWDNHFTNMNLDAFIAARADAVGLGDLAEVLPDGPPPRSEDPPERFWAWMEADPTRVGGGLAATLHHLATFWGRRQLGNIALFHFADLEADLEGEMRRLAGALGIEVAEGSWPRLMAPAAFESMRGRADELAPEVDVAGFWHDNARFFNRGLSGQWRAFMTEEDLARYTARIRELAPPDLAQWAQFGWRATPRQPVPGA